MCYPGNAFDYVPGPVIFDFLVYLIAIQKLKIFFDPCIIILKNIVYHGRAYFY